MSPAAQNFKPFGIIQDGTDLKTRGLTESVRGAAGRYATEPKNEHDQLVDKTRTWVAETFFGTLLKQMRDSPFKSEMFSGGKGGEAFGGMQDQHMAEHMARGAGSKLVNSIVRKIEAAAAYRKQAGQVTPTTKTDNKTDDHRHGSNPRESKRPHVATALRA